MNLEHGCSEVDQKGSLCDEDKLRFDFTAKSALTSEQLSEVCCYV